MGTNACSKEPRRGGRTTSRRAIRSPHTNRSLTPLQGWRVSGRVPQGLRPGLLSSAPDGAWDRAGTRHTLGDDLGAEARTRAEDVETPEAGLACPGLDIMHYSSGRYFAIPAKRYRLMSEDGRPATREDIRRDI